MNKYLIALFLGLAIGVATTAPAEAPLTPQRCMKVFAYADFGTGTKYLDWHQVCSRGPG